VLLYQGKYCANRWKSFSSGMMQQHLKGGCLKGRVLAQVQVAKAAEQLQAVKVAAEQLLENENPWRYPAHLML
jgi:hypothetical protein